MGGGAERVGPRLGCPSTRTMTLGSQCPHRPAEGWIRSQAHLLSKGQASLVFICATSQTCGAKRKSLFCCPTFRAGRLAHCFEISHTAGHISFAELTFTHTTQPLVTGLCILRSQATPSAQVPSTCLLGGSVPPRPTDNKLTHEAWLPRANFSSKQMRDFKRTCHHTQTRMHTHVCGHPSLSGAITGEQGHEPAQTSTGGQQR